MVYKVLKEQCPNYFKKYFQNVRETHSFYTRASIADLKTPVLTSKVGRASFQYTGVEEWNKIPNKIKFAQSLNVFKKEVKNWLMSKLE